MRSHFLVGIATVALAVAACSSAVAPGPAGASTDASTPVDGAVADAAAPDAPPEPPRDAAPDSPVDSPVDSATPTGLGPGPYAIVYAGTAIGIDQRTATAATFQGQQLTGYTASVNEAPTVGTNQVFDVGGDALVLYGRWAGGTTAGKFYQSPPFTFAPSGGLHYAIGIPSSPGAIPGSGSAAYQVLGKTTATRADGSKATGTATAKVVSAFAGAGTRLGLEITLDIPGDGQITITSTGGAADPAQSQVKVATSSSFFRDESAAAPLGVSGAAAVCATRCVASVAGFFAGPQAERAALVVHVYPGGGGAPESLSAAFELAR